MNDSWFSYCCSVSFILHVSSQGSRYKLFSNGTLMINSAEVNDAQIYSCVCKSEGGSLNAHARVFILGEVHVWIVVHITIIVLSPGGLLCLEDTCVSDYLMFLLEKLKFTPVPQRSQCLQLDRENTVSCVAQGRETPTILWRRTGLRLTILHSALL